MWPSVTLYQLIAQTLCQGRKKETEHAAETDGIKRIKKLLIRKKVVYFCRCVSVCGKAKKEDFPNQTSNRLPLDLLAESLSLKDHRVL
jgi:hypothetical protein